MQSQTACFAENGNGPATAYPNYDRDAAGILALTYVTTIVVLTSIRARGRILGMSDRFDSPEQEVFLNLWRTYDSLKAIEDQLLSEFNLTAQQYNALRILQESPVQTMEIGRRLVSRCPDTTRLLDRLEKQGLISRTRLTSNRRVVEVCLTSDGKKLLKRLATRVVEMHHQQVGHLTKKEQTQLVKLLKQARSPHSGEP